MTSNFNKDLTDKIPKLTNFNTERLGGWKECNSRVKTYKGDATVEVAID